MGSSQEDIENFVKNHPSFIHLLAIGNDAAPTKKQRLDLYFELVGQMPMPVGMIEAKGCCDAILNIIEDQFSGVKFSPETWMNDGRMYPAQADSRRKCASDDVSHYRHKAHSSYFGANGAIKIESSPNFGVGTQVYVDRVGSDGKRIDDILAAQPVTFYGGGSRAIR